MHIAVYLPLLLSAPLVAGLRLLGRWAPPRVASWLVLTGSAVLAGTTVLCLGLLVVAGLAGWTWFAAVAGWSPVAVRAAAPVPQWAGLLAGVLLCAAVGAAAVCGARYLRHKRAADRAAHVMCAPLVVLDDPTPVAYAVPGGAGHVVVSRGMLGLLDATGRRAVLAHERAHLRCRHHVFVAGVRLLSAVNPVLLPLRRTVVYTTERWADEIAAAVVGDRGATADAIAAAALATRTRPVPGTLSATAGPVPSRVAALLGVPEPGSRLPRTPWLTLCTAAVTAVLLALIGVGALDAATDLHENIETAQCLHQSTRERCADTDTTGHPANLPDLVALTWSTAGHR